MDGDAARGWKALAACCQGPEGATRSPAASCQGFRADVQTCGRRDGTMNRVERHAEYQRVDALLTSGRFDLAEPRLRALHAADPRDPVPPMALARGLRGAARYDEAEHFARLTVQLRPNWVASHRTLAVVLHGAGRPREGLVAAAEVIRLAPADGQSYEWAVACHYDLDEFERTVELARHGLSLDPSRRVLQHHLAMGLGGLQRAAEAQAVVAGFLREQAAVPIAQAAAGWTFWQLRQLDRAAEHFTIALSLRPDGPWTHEGLGMVRLAKGDPPAAYRHLSESARLDSNLGRGRAALEQLRRQFADDRSPVASDDGATFA
jgi:tetratricopeptide (TPR) repeat protein